MDLFHDIEDNHRDTTPEEKVEVVASIRARAANLLASVKQVGPVGVEAREQAALGSFLRLSKKVCN
jgi:hypothetical protein